jgi:Asp-tRNA(Asn)/Glu-tRNA(Gln) amidotransferase A subunit family amidase
MDLKGCRVAWYTGDGVAPVTEETQKAVAAAARVLAESGLKVQENPPPGIERGHELWLKLFSRASVVQLRSVYSGREDEGGSFVRWRLRTADDLAPSSLDEYIQNWIERDAVRMELLQWFEEVPLILAPVGATNAFEHDALKVEVNGSLVSVFRAFSYSQAFNVFDLPAVSIPVARSAMGLPIGVQIAGRPFAEELVLKAAAILEEAGPLTIAN